MPTQLVIEREAEPSAPHPTADDRDVVEYLNDIKAWGRKGWTYYESLKAWALEKGD